MRTMTLGEFRTLIDDLVEAEGDEVLDLPLYGEHDYGDHCHTRALAAFSDLQVVRPKKSAYSETGLALTKDGDDGDEEPVAALTSE